MRYYCTYFDKNYLLKGLALIKSLQVHEPEPFTLFVVCLDELTQEALNRLAVPQVKAVDLAEIEAEDPELAAARHNRTLVEYYWTLTPSIISYFLKNLPGNEIITYLDADLYFFSTPAPIYAALDSGSVLIHGHRFSPELAFLAQYGTYNVGLLCFRNDANGRNALGWWRERCIEWCYKRVEDGKFGDQLYLEDWPARFEGVRILDHEGGGVAPWNQGKYAFSVSDNGSPLVNGSPIIFYHFHAFAFVTPLIVLPAKDLHYPVPARMVACCVVPYLHCLEQQLLNLHCIMPDFAHGLTLDEPLTEKHSFIARTAIIGTLQREGVTHPCIDLGNGWHLFRSSQTADDDADAASSRMPRPAKRDTPEQTNIQICRTLPLPTISLVTPSYNQSEYLEECIDSILGQGYPNLEYVIMDGGSTDGSVDIIKKHEKYLTYWQSRPDGGQYPAINAGFRHTTGEIMTWLNSDDKFHPLAFAKVVAAFLDNPDIQWLCGSQSTWDVAGHLSDYYCDLLLLTRKKYLTGNFSRPFIQQEGTFWRKSLWDAAGSGLDERFELAADLELWARFFKHAQLYQLNAFVGGFRSHGNQKSVLQRKAYYAEAQTVLAHERAIFKGDIGLLPQMPELVQLDPGAMAHLLKSLEFEGLSRYFEGVAWSVYLNDITEFIMSIHERNKLDEVDFLLNELICLKLAGAMSLTFDELLLRKMLVLKQEAQQLFEQAEQACAAGEAAIAADLLCRAQRIAPQDGRLFRNLGQLHLRRGEYLNALLQYDKVLVADPYNEEYLCEAVNLLLQDGLIITARKCCQEFLWLNPHSTMVEELLGQIPAQASIGIAKIDSGTTTSIIT